MAIRKPPRGNPTLTTGRNNTVTLNLDNGMNLIAPPVTPADGSEFWNIQEFFDSFVTSGEVTQVIGFGYAGQVISGTWYGSLQEIKPYNGYWVRCESSSCTLTISGLDVHPNHIFNLIPGANLIGSPIPDGSPPGQWTSEICESGITNAISAGESFHCANQGLIGAFMYFSSGEGAWFFSDSHMSINFNDYWGLELGCEAMGQITCQGDQGYVPGVCANSLDECPPCESDGISYICNNSSSPLFNSCMPGPFGQSTDACWEYIDTPDSDSDFFGENATNTNIDGLMVIDGTGAGRTDWNTLWEDSYQNFQPAALIVGSDIETDGYDGYIDDYGVLYNWWAVQQLNICPPGTRVATKEDWESLINSVGDNPGNKLKSLGTDYWNSSLGEDTIGFDGRGTGGIIDYGSGWELSSVKDLGYYWTSTGWDITGTESGNPEATRGYVAILGASSGDVLLQQDTNTHAGHGYAVRCVYGGEVGTGEGQIDPGIPDEIWWKRTEDYNYLGWIPADACALLPDCLADGSNADNCCNSYEDPLMAGRGIDYYEELRRMLNNPSGRNEYADCLSHPAYFTGFQATAPQYVTDVTDVGNMPGGCWRTSYQATSYGDSQDGNLDIGCCDNALNVFGGTGLAWFMGYHDCNVMDGFYFYMCGGCSCPYTPNAFAGMSIKTIDNGNIVDTGLSLEPYHLTENNDVGLSIHAVGPSCPHYMCVGGTYGRQICDGENGYGVTEYECIEGGGAGCHQGSGCAWGHKAVIEQPGYDWSQGSSWASPGWDSTDYSCCPGCTNPRSTDDSCFGEYGKINENEIDWENESWNFTMAPIDQSGSPGPAWVNGSINNRLDWCVGICSKLDSCIPYKSDGSYSNDYQNFDENTCGYWEPTFDADGNLIIDFTVDDYNCYGSDGITPGGCTGWSNQLGKCVYKGCQLYQECYRTCDSTGNGFCVDNCQDGTNNEYNNDLGVDGGLCPPDSDNDGICDIGDIGPGPGGVCEGEPDTTQPSNSEHYSYANCPYNCFGCDNRCCDPNLAGDCAVSDICGVCDGDGSGDQGCGCNATSGPVTYCDDSDGDGLPDTNNCVEVCESEGTTPASYPLVSEYPDYIPITSGEADEYPGCASNLFDGDGECCVEGTTFVDACGICNGTNGATRWTCSHYQNPVCGGPWYDQCGDIITDGTCALSDVYDCSNEYYNSDYEYSPDCNSDTGFCGCDNWLTSMGCPCGHLLNGCNQCQDYMEPSFVDSDGLWNCAEATQNAYGGSGDYDAYCGPQLTNQCGLNLGGCGNGSCNDPKYPNCVNGKCVCSAGAQDCAPGSETGCTCDCGEFEDLCGNCAPEGGGVTYISTCEDIGLPSLEPQCGGPYYDECGQVIVGCGEGCASQGGDFALFYPNCVSQVINGVNVGYCQCTAGAENCAEGATANCECPCGQYKDCDGICNGTAENDMCDVCNGGNGTMDCRADGGPSAGETLTQPSAEFCDGTHIWCNCYVDSDGDGLGTGNPQTICNDGGTGANIPSTAANNYSDVYCPTACANAGMVYNSNDPDDDCAGVRDCNGTCNGNAYFNTAMDVLGNDINCECVGPGTGNPADYGINCDGVCSNQTTAGAYIDECGFCSGGQFSNHLANSDKDCAGNCPDHEDYYSACNQGPGANDYQNQEFGCGNDQCGICGGQNWTWFCTAPHYFDEDWYPTHCSDMDCAGNCGAERTHFIDECGNCEPEGQGCVQDCNGVYGGTYSEDMCGECLPLGTADPNACTQDCSLTWGGSLCTDVCGYCGDYCGGDPQGNPTSCDAPCQDCAGVCGPGTNWMNNCNQCVPENDTSCQQDCAGVWGGTASYDNCNICLPQGVNDPNACTQDCAGTWGGTLEYSACGTGPENCGTNGCECTNCTATCTLSGTCSTANDEAYTYGVSSCLGYNQCSPCTYTITGCQGDGCNGNVCANDPCIGVDALDCSAAAYDGCYNGECGCNAGLDCEGVCGGSAVVDSCGICGGNNATLFSCSQSDGYCGSHSGNGGAPNGYSCVGADGCVDGPTTGYPGKCNCAGNMWDECDVCDGLGPTYNCGSLCGGTQCGAADCDTLVDSNYNCNGTCAVTVDCAGVCGGQAVVDDCGVCGGNNASQDSCGVCNGSGPGYECWNGDLACSSSACPAVEYCTAHSQCPAGYYCDGFSSGSMNWGEWDYFGCWVCQVGSGFDDTECGHYPCRTDDSCDYEGCTDGWGYDHCDCDCSGYGWSWSQAECDMWMCTSHCSCWCQNSYTGGTNYDGDVGGCIINGPCTGVCTVDIGCCEDMCSSHCDALNSDPAWDGAAGGLVQSGDVLDGLFNPYHDCGVHNNKQACLGVTDNGAPEGTCNWDGVACFCKSDRNDDPHCPVYGLSWIGGSVRGAEDILSQSPTGMSNGAGINPITGIWTYEQWEADAMVLKRHTQITKGSGYLAPKDRGRKIN